MKEATQDSRSGLKLKHLLVLISRILAILCLVFAFAQPYIPTGNAASIDNTSFIYIDNSYSMEAAGKDGNLLNEAKNQAIELVRSLAEDEKIALLTSDLLASQLRFYTKAEVIEQIKTIDFSARPTELTAVLNTQVDMIASMENESNNRIFVFSDFQESTSELDDFRREEVNCYYYQPVAQQEGNIYIDSVWFETPVHRLNIPSEIFFRVYNSSSMAQQDLSVSLRVEGGEPAPKRISVEANSFAIGSFTFTDRTPGTKKGSISVSTSQLFFDDEYFFTYETMEQVDILIVKNTASDNANLEQLYGLDPYYHYETTTIDGLTREQFADKELIVLQNIDRISSGVQDLIDESLKSGSTVALIPGREPDFQSWNDYLRNHRLPYFDQQVSRNSELAYFNSEDPLYTGVFETTPENYKNPYATAYYRMITSSDQNYITLFGFRETWPFMIWSSQANGRLVVLGAPLDVAFTDFQNHALFAATFLRLAETSSFQKPLSMTIGEMANYPFNVRMDEKNPVHLVNEEYGVDFIPMMINTGTTRAISFAQAQDQLSQAGFYMLTDQAGFNDVLALNYSRVESNVECLDKEEIAAEFGSAGWENAQPLEQDPAGRMEVRSLKAFEFWRILIIMSLIFLAVEILLLKLWKS